MQSHGQSHPERNVPDDPQQTARFPVTDSTLTIGFSIRCSALARDTPDGFKAVRQGD